jgi:hypothetical protein
MGDDGKSSSTLDFIDNFRFIHRPFPPSVYTIMYTKPNVLIAAGVARTVPPAGTARPEPLKYYSGATLPVGSKEACSLVASGEDFSDVGLLFKM